MHLAHFGQLGAFRIFCKGADGKDVGECRALSLFDHKASYRGAIVHGPRVRHCANSREAAGYSSRSAAGDRFLVFVTRLAQVHVHIDKTRRDDEASRVKNFSSFRHAVTVSRKSDHAAVLNEEVLAGVDSL